jgi:hypothetical protein
VWIRVEAQDAPKRPNRCRNDVILVDVCGAHGRTQILVPGIESESEFLLATPDGAFMVLVSPDQSACR